MNLLVSLALLEPQRARSYSCVACQSGSFWALSLFRSGLLQGCAIALSGQVPDAISELLASLGADVRPLDTGNAGEDEELEARGREIAPLDVLICGDGSMTEPRTVAELGLAESLGRALGLGEHEWSAVKAAALGALIPGGGGRIMLLAPPAGDWASPAAAALENLARTLSVEWARYQITVTALVPGPHTSDEELATLIAFLSSPAGAYYSGCRFDLGTAEVST